MLILVIDDWCISCEIAISWMSLDLTDDKSTLVQVMAWCRQATSHYLSQCWPRSMSPYGVIRSQWVKSVISECMYGVRFMSFSGEIALRSIAQKTFDDESTLVQVIAWCCQATSHYLSHCWTISYHSKSSSIILDQKILLGLYLYCPNEVDGSILISLCPSVGTYVRQSVDEITSTLNLPQ